MAFQGRKTAAARGRPGERPPSGAHPRGLPGHGKPSTAARSAAHSPASKRPLEQQSASAWQGSGGAEPPDGAPDHASPCQARACPCCTRSACYRRPQTGRTAHPHGGAVTEQRTTRTLASPCVGASSAGGSLRGASATCALQPRLVPRRQSEAGAPRRMGANRHGGRRRRPRWSWKLPFEIERIQGRL